MLVSMIVLVSMRAGWGNSYASEYDSVGWGKFSVSESDRAGCV